MSVNSVVAKTDVIDGAEEIAHPALEDLRAAAQMWARAEVSDAVVEALHADGRSLRQIQKDSGLDPAFVSRIANGEKGATVASLALIALALGKSLKISIE